MLGTPAYRRTLVLPIVTILLTGMISVLAAATDGASARTNREDKIVKAYKVAKAQQGDPYVYGADGPDAFDCSGLTQYAYGRAGIRLPRTSDQQAAAVRRLKKRRNIKRGDFMFFAQGGDVYHMGLFTGRWEQGRRVILHASRTGTPVKTDPVWTGQWFAGTLRPRR